MLTHLTHPHPHNPLYNSCLLCASPGGDGEATFALPDLRDRKILGKSADPGQFFPIGLSAGTNVLGLTVPNLPPHTHGYEGT